MANLSIIRKSEVTLLPSTIESIVNQLTEEQSDEKFIDVIRHMSDYVMMYRQRTWNKEEWVLEKIENVTMEKYAGWSYQHPAEFMLDNGIDLGLCMMLLSFNHTEFDHIRSINDYRN